MANYRQPAANSSFEENNAIYHTQIESDPIKKALVGLSPDTRQSLLAILLAAQSDNQQQQQTVPVNHQIYHQLNLDPQMQSTSHLNYLNPLNFIPSLLSNNNHQQQQLHSEISSPMLSDQVSNFHSKLPDSIPNQITPALSPSMTPLSTFSTSSYPNSATISDALSSHSSVHPPFQPSNNPLEFLSPLTSPALRPLAYHDPAQMSRTDLNNQVPSNFQPVAHNMPALIDQAASLGLSTHQSFMVGDGISNNASSAQCDHNNQPIQLSSHTHLASQASAIFSSQSGFITHSKSTARASPVQPKLDSGICLTEPVHRSPISHPHHSSNCINVPSTPTASSSKLSGRQRPSLSSKTRPSPLLRPLDKCTESREDRASSAKRARSLTGASISMSPSFPSGLAKMGLADSPSPIDMQSRELHSTSTTSSSSVADSSTTNSSHLHAPSTMPPPPHGLSAMPSNPNGWHIQPMTPASLFNFDSSLMVETSMGNPVTNLQSAESGCGRTLKSSQETNEMGQASEEKTSQLTQEKEGTENEQSNLQDKSLQVEQPDAESSRSDSKEKAPTSGSNSVRSKSKENNTKGKRNGATKVRLDSMVMMNNEDEGPEHRKSSHKVAEQRRRDSLKMCFEDLRHILPPIQWNEKEEGQAQDRRPGEGNVGGQRSVNAFDPLNPNKGMSKVALLRRSNEYILRLQERLKRRDEAIEMLIQMLAEHQRGHLFNYPDQPQKTQEPPPRPSPQEVGSTGDGSLSSRPSTTHPCHLLGENIVVDIHEESNPDQEMLGGLRTILGRIRMEKQEDKDDHRHHHQTHTNRSHGSLSGEELD